MHPSGKPPPKSSPGDRRPLRVASPGIARDATSLPLHTPAPPVAAAAGLEPGPYTTSYMYRPRDRVEYVVLPASSQAPSKRYRDRQPVTRLSVLLHPQANATFRDAISMCLASDPIAAKSAPPLEGVIAKVSGVHPLTGCIDVTDLNGPGSVLRADCDLTTDTETLETRIEINDLAQHVQLMLRLKITTSELNRERLQGKGRELSAKIQEYEDKVAELNRIEEIRQGAILEVKKVVTDRESEIARLNALVENELCEKRLLEEEVSALRAAEETRRAEREKEKQIAAQHERQRQKEREEAQRHAARRAMECAQEEERRRRYEVEKRARVAEQEQIQQERVDREKERIVERQREQQRNEERAANSAKEAEWRIRTMQLLQEMANCAKCRDRNQIAAELSKLKETSEELKNLCDTLQAELLEVRRREHELLHPTLRLSGSQQEVTVCIPSVAPTELFPNGLATFNGCAYSGTLCVQIQGGYVESEDRLLLLSYDELSGWPRSSRTRVRLIPQSSPNGASHKIVDVQTGVQLGLMEYPATDSPKTLQITFTPEIGCIAADVSLLLQHIALLTTSTSGQREIEARLTIRVKEGTGVLRELTDGFTLVAKLYPIQIHGSLSESIGYSECEACMPFSQLQVSQGTFPSWLVNAVEVIPRGVPATFEILGDMFRIERSGDMLRCGTLVGHAEGQFNAIKSDGNDGLRQKSPTRDGKHTKISFTQPIDASDFCALLRGLRVSCTHISKLDHANIDITVHISFAGQSQFSLTSRLNFVCDPQSVEMDLGPERTLKCRANQKYKSALRQQAPFIGKSLHPEAVVKTQVHSRLGTGRIECSVLNSTEGDQLLLVAPTGGFEVTNDVILQDNIPVCTLLHVTSSHIQVTFHRTGMLFAATVQLILRAIAFATDSSDPQPREVRTCLTVVGRSLVEVTKTVQLHGPLLVMPTARAFDYHDGDSSLRVCSATEVKEDEAVINGLTIIAEILQGKETTDILDLRKEHLDGPLSLTDAQRHVKLVICDDDTVAISTRSPGKLELKFRTEGMSSSPNQKKPVKDKTTSQKKEWGRRPIKNAAKELAAILRALSYHVRGTASHDSKLLRISYVDSEHCVADILISIRVIHHDLVRSTRHTAQYTLLLKEPCAVPLCPTADFVGINFEEPRPYFTIRVDVSSGYVEGDQLGFMPAALQTRKVKKEPLAGDKVRSAAKKLNPSIKKLNDTVSSSARDFPLTDGPHLFYVIGDILMYNGVDIGKAHIESSRCVFSVQDVALEVTQFLLQSIAFFTTCDATPSQRTFVIHVKCGREQMVRNRNDSLTTTTTVATSRSGGRSGGSDGIAFDYRIAMECVLPYLGLASVVPLEGPKVWPCKRLIPNVTPAGKALHVTVSVEVKTNGVLELVPADDMMMTSVAPPSTASRALYSGKISVEKNYLADVDTSLPTRLVLTTGGKSTMTWDQLLGILQRITYTGEGRQCSLLRVDIACPSMHQVVHVPMCLAPGTHTEREPPTLFALQSEITVPSTARAVRVGQWLYVANSTNCDSVTSLEMSLPRLWLCPLLCTIADRDTKEHFTVDPMETGVRVTFIHPPDGGILRQVMQSLHVERKEESHVFAEANASVDVTITLLGVKAAVLSTVVITLVPVEVNSSPEVRTITAPCSDQGILPGYIEKRTSFVRGRILIEVCNVSRVSLLRDLSLVFYGANSGFFVDPATNAVIVPSHPDTVVGVASTVLHRIEVTLDNASAEAVQRIVRSPTLTISSKTAQAPHPMGDGWPTSPVAFDIRVSVVDAYGSEIEHIVTMRLQ